MSATSLGLVGLAYKGDYQSSVTYVRGNVVYYNGSSWYAKQTVSGVLPNPGAYWGYIAKGADIDAMVTSVNGETGDVVITRVAEAENLYSPDVQEDIDSYIFRTAGGSADLSSGDAVLATVVGSCVHPTGGSISIATPTAFKAMGLNQFNPINVLNNTNINQYGSLVDEDGKKTLWVHAVRGNTTGYAVYSPNGAILRTGWYASVPQRGNTVNILAEYNVQDEEGVLYHVLPPTDDVNGQLDCYIVVAVSDTSQVCVHPSWSGYMDEEYAEYSESIITLPTKDKNNNDLPLASYGFPSCSGVADSISFTERKYYRNIGHLGYSAENLAYVQSITSQYDYDATHIFYVDPNPTVYNLATTFSGTYTVHDFGTEEWVGTTVPLSTTHHYGQNLRDKLRRDVVTISEQTLSTSEQAQVRENIGAGNVKTVNNIEPDAAGNVEVSRVAIAENIYSPDNQEDTDLYIFRTSCGSASIDYSSEAELMYVRGNSTVTGRLDEVIDAQATNNVTVAVTATTWRQTTYGAESGTYIFNYTGSTGQWTIGGTTVSLPSLGVTVSGIKQDTILTQINKPDITVETDPVTWIAKYGRNDVTAHAFNYNADGKWYNDQSEEVAVTIDASTHKVTFTEYGITLSAQPTAYFSDFDSDNTDIKGHITGNVATFISAYSAILGQAVTSGTYRFEYTANGWVDSSSHSIGSDLTSIGISYTGGTVQVGNWITATFVEAATTLTGQLSPRTESSILTIRYTKAAQGTINVATPTVFQATGTNQFDEGNFVIADCTINASGEIVAEEGYSVGYVHVVGGLSQGYTIYDKQTSGIGSLVEYFGWSATIPELGDTVDTSIITAADPTMSFATIPTSGYLVFAFESTDVTPTVEDRTTGICVHPTWSGYMNTWYEKYSKSTIVLPMFEAGEDLDTDEFTPATAIAKIGADGTTQILYDAQNSNWKLNGTTVTIAQYGVTLDTEHTAARREGTALTIVVSDYGTSTQTATAVFQQSLPIRLYGMPSVETVRDELNLDLHKYYQKIGRIAYSASNLVDVQAKGVPYDYDLSYIYWQLTDSELVTYDTDPELSNLYTAADFGTEEFLGTSVAVQALHLYGQNLRDKLRTDVLTISRQTLTEAQQLVVQENIGMAGEDSHINYYSATSATNMTVKPNQELYYSTDIQTPVSEVLTTSTFTGTVTIVHATFVAKLSAEQRTETFVYNSDAASWRVNGVNVTLADYGITITDGTPNNGDTMIVDSKKPIFTLSTDGMQAEKANEWRIFFQNTSAADVTITLYCQGYTLRGPDGYRANTCNFICDKTSWCEISAVRIGQTNGIIFLYSCFPNTALS